LRRLRSIIVDDELQARSAVRALLDDDPEVRVVGEAATASEAVGAIRELRPDLVLLDVELPDGSGFDALEELGEYPLPIVVFITTFDAYTVQAFDGNAVDYLVKPFTPGRFRRALEKAKSRHRQLEADAFRDRLRSLLQDETLRRQGTRDSRLVSVHNPPPLRRLSVTLGDEVQLLRVEDVDWIEAAQYCVHVHVARESYLLRGHLGSYERRLDPRQFVRIHRSTIVNLDRVTHVKRWVRGEGIAVLRDGTELKVSRSHRQRLEMLLQAG